MANHEVASRKFADLACRVELKAPGVGFEPPAIPVLGRMNTGSLSGCGHFLLDN